MRKGEELKTPRHASAAASRDDRLPHSRHLSLLFSIAKKKRKLSDYNDTILRIKAALKELYIVLNLNIL